MSQGAQVGEVLRRYARAWEAGDLAEVLGSYHDEFTLHYFGQSPLAGAHHGKETAVKVLADATARSERVVDVLADATARSERVLVRVVDVLAGDQSGALVVVERLGPADQPREVQRVLVYRTEDDKLRECWLYDEDQRFVDQLWGRAPG